MRHWNGLKINDKVLYHKKEYILLKLYENSEKKVCDLRPIAPGKDLKEISIYDCIRLD